MPSPQPFKLHVPDASLALLSTKLSTVRLPTTNPDGWTEQHGVPLASMERLLPYWLNSYLPRWREREAELNKFPMYTMPVDAGEFGTLNIHFVWIKAKRSNAVPLLFVHGWPGLFLEGKKIWDQLADGENDGVVFDVVVPSLPNFGFSDGVNKKGFHLGKYAMVMHNLMTNLGYDKYVIQGGDWGSMISRRQAAMYPDAVKAVHVNLAGLSWGNMFRSPLVLLKFFLWPWTAAEETGLQTGRRYLSDGFAYYRIQSTRPLTTAYLLCDSPVALLGYVWEKIIQWSDNAEDAWTDDELLDWISIYWFSTAGPGASVAIYHEAETEINKGGGGYWDWQPAPLGITQFPRDIVGMPSAALRLLGNVVFERWANKGGHFAAWEVPGELIKDLRAMFRKGGAAYGVVEGRDGYDEGKKDI